VPRVYSPFNPEEEKKKEKSAAEDVKEKEAIKKQMKEIYYYRDMLERSLSKNELVELLEKNAQEAPSSPVQSATGSLCLVAAWDTSAWATSPSGPNVKTRLTNPRERMH
jgi:hypothetical protein